MRLPALLLSALWLTAPHAGEVRIAAASNFASPLEGLAREFTDATGHRAVVASAATGKLYAQIRNGAPFDVLLAADDEIPARLEAAGLAVPGTRFTYATGRLALWTASAEGAPVGPDSLRAARGRIAIANPRVAPYGRAAVEALRDLGLYEAVEGRLVMGENIAQAHQFAASGNAAFGLVAQAQVWRAGRFVAGRGWLVPEVHHAPIRQDAVLLHRGRDNPAARAFLTFLATDPARALIRAAGYDR